MRRYRHWILTTASAALIGFSPALLAEKAEIRGIGVYEIPGWFKQSFLDLREEVSDAAANKKRLLIYFGQNGCPYCAELFNNNFSQKHIVDYTRHHFDSIDINIWGDRQVTDLDGQVLGEKQFAEKHKVWFTPTIIFFDEKTKQVLRINGYYPPHDLMAALRYVAEHQELKQGFTEYKGQLKLAAASGRLNHQNFFVKPPYDLAEMSKSKPVAIFFEQADCYGCDALHGSIFKQTATQQQLKRFHVVQLDRWERIPVTTPSGAKSTARDWADQLGIAYVPTAVLFDRGKEVIRMEAMLKAFHVQSVLDYAASGAYQRQPSLQRFIQERADHLREQGIAVDLWK
jgi:thioredoxin-related protein